MPRTIFHRARNHTLPLKSPLLLALAVTAIQSRPARADLVYAWGYNSFGQLGDGTTTNQRAPAATAVLSGGVTAVASGDVFSLAVQNGALFGWGYDGDGQLLGSPQTNYSTRPVPLVAFSTGVTAIAAGEGHGLALQNGRVYAWGDNQSGELGDGTASFNIYPTPVAVLGLSSGVTAIAGGRLDSFAIQNGALYAWGINDFGQLGDGTTTQRNTPVAISGFSRAVTAIAAGDSHGLAVKSGGAYAWGNNDHGDLGDGTTTERDSPIPVLGLSSGVTAVAVGNYHSLAVKDGGVYAWGGNDAGELGDGTRNDQSTPERIDPADLTNIVAVAAGFYDSYALSSDGTLWVWGYNGAGELGLGNRNTSLFVLTPQHLLPPAGYLFTSIDADADGEQALATLAPIPGAVPEPTSLLLSLPALTLLSRARRRH